MPVAPARPIDRIIPDREAPVSVQDVFVSDLTLEESAAGFAVCPVEHPDGSAATVPAVLHAWGDPCHRLVKTRGRDGAVFQLQAFGRRRAGAGNGPLGWYAERYWPARYGTAWVLDRLREYLGRPRYRPVIDLHLPPTDTVPPTAPVPPPAAVPVAA
jgi:hypothetical protein